MFNATRQDIERHQLKCFILMCITISVKLCLLSGLETLNYDQYTIQMRMAINRFGSKVRLAVGKNKLPPLQHIPFTQNNPVLKSMVFKYH